MGIFAKGIFESSLISFKSVFTFAFRSPGADHAIRNDRDGGVTVIDGQDRQIARA
jgi:hypothetical protein